MKGFAIFLTALLMTAVLFTGCGNKIIDLNEYVDIEVEGFDTIGTATVIIDFWEMVEENPEAFDLGDDPSNRKIEKVCEELSKEIRGSLTKKVDLSNGEVIKFVWAHDDIEEIIEDYPVQFMYKDIEFTVENLETAEMIDPFDYLTVNFTGVAPNGCIEMGVTEVIPELNGFIADKTTGLKNGDVVTIEVLNAETVNSQLLRSGKLLSETTKTYTVEGLASYAMELNDITSDMMDKMKNQAEDSIEAYTATWKEGNTLEKCELIGSYFLSIKDGFEPSFWDSNNNLYLVYKLTTNMTGALRNDDTRTICTGEEVFYTYLRYTDIMVLPDGTCSVNLSNGTLCDNSIDTLHGEWSIIYFPYHVYGYYDLDSMFNDVVTMFIDRYNYESTVE